MPPDPLEGEHALHAMSALAHCIAATNQWFSHKYGSPYNFLPCYAPDFALDSFSPLNSLWGLPKNLIIGMMYSSTQLNHLCSKA